MTTISGIVTNGIVVANTELPEGAIVEIHLQRARFEIPSPGELRKLPREERQSILVAPAEIAAPDYRDDKELTGFEAFREEELKSH